MEVYIKDIDWMIKNTEPVNIFMQMVIYTMGNDLKVKQFLLFLIKKLI